MAQHTFTCLDGHTCGNPVRLVTGGAPILKGATMSERRADFLARWDWIRRALMFEPRGHDVMSGSMLYAPTRADCDIAILFIETSGCLPMCGHGTIGTVTMALENGLVSPARDGEVALDAPAGTSSRSLPGLRGVISPFSRANVTMPIVPWPHIGRQPLVSMNRIAQSQSGSVGG